MTLIITLIGTIFNTLKPLIFLYLGLEIGFYIVGELISGFLGRRKKEKEEKEEERKVKHIIGGVDVGTKPIRYWES